MGSPRDKIATFYDRKKNVIRTIRYSCVEKAIPRLLYHAMSLEPGTTIQITHAYTGLWIGDIIVKVNNEITSCFTWDETGVVHKKDRAIKRRK